jgi:uncharacterized protein (TIGR02679 family)
VKEEQAIRSYFGHKGFERFLKLLQRQYMSSQDGVRGYATIANISDMERSTLDRFYETYSPPAQGETKRYSLKKFEQLLMNSRFGLKVPELLELLNGEPILTRREQALRIKEEWEDVIRSAMEETFAAAPDGVDSPVRSWAQGLMEESSPPSPGSRTLRIVFAKSPEEARLCLKCCLTALNGVVASRTERPIRLPILAAQTTGNAHALDWKYPLGRLFWWGLTAIHGQALVGEVSEDNQLELADLSDASDSQAILIREGYRRGGVADDDLSSQAIVYAPELFRICEERVLTLRQVERLSPERLTQMRYTRIYMVENPSVFAELIDADAWARERAEAAAPVILCGNGQPSTAVVKLLDALLSNREGAALYYAGDLDPAGLGIAQSLRLRYPQAFRAWRMDKEQYLRYAHRGVLLTEAESSRLKECQYEWDAALANALSENGVKLHQELWVDELIRDMVHS